VVDAGKLALGKHIHIQAWRQITIGIARRKFTAIEANLPIEEREGADRDETDAAVAADSLLSQ
jgi:hypothetical protein